MPPINLHMGVVLPFLGSCLGPKTKGLFLMHPSVLNLFWINVTASSVRKSLMRHRFILELMDFIMKNLQEKIKNFEISWFTYAGKMSYIIFINIYM